ncbi:aldo/keto reductase [Variovorax paradoxus]|uniref:NADP-dependent oxidoreductase domain-containing protein n=1 Tax=Variovorax paradoxus TaxID=34073 RepID=A0A679JFQ3_VARPD|nr:hypothetical protein VVAX_05539 [Variovorax paradoxus]
MSRAHEESGKNDGLPQRELGRTGLLANAMALGCYSMSNAYGARTDAESLQVIRRATDRGVNVIDAADFYGWGHNEELVDEDAGPLAADRRVQSPEALSTSNLLRPRGSGTNTSHVRACPDQRMRGYARTCLSISSMPTAGQRIDR